MSGTFCHLSLGPLTIDLYLTWMGDGVGDLHRHAQNIAETCRVFGTFLTRAIAASSTSRSADFGKWRRSHGGLNASKGNGPKFRKVKLADSLRPEPWPEARRGPAGVQG